MPDKSPTWELVRIRTGREPDELIRELYVDQGLSDRQVAKELGVNRATVNQWRQELGIHRDAPAPQATA